MVVSHSAMKKVEKCWLTILCIRFVDQQNALWMEVMMIDDENFFLIKLTCSTSLFSNFYSRKNWFDHRFLFVKHVSMEIRGGTNSSGSLGTLRTPPDWNLGCNSKEPRIWQQNSVSGGSYSSRKGNAVILRWCSQQRKAKDAVDGPLQRLQWYASNGRVPSTIGTGGRCQSQQTCFATTLFPLHDPRSLRQRMR